MYKLFFSVLPFFLRAEKWDGCSQWDQQLTNFLVYSQPVSFLMFHTTANIQVREVPYIYTHSFRRDIPGRRTSNPKPLNRKKNYFPSNITFIFYTEIGEDADGQTHHNFQGEVAVIFWMKRSQRKFIVVT